MMMREEGGGGRRSNVVYWIKDSEYEKFNKDQIVNLSLICWNREKLPSKYVGLSL